MAFSHCYNLMEGLHNLGKSFATYLTSHSQVGMELCRHSLQFQIHFIFNLSDAAFISLYHKRTKKEYVDLFTEDVSKLCGVWLLFYVFALRL